jgi:hypothetical protein
MSDKAICPSKESPSSLSTAGASKMTLFNQKVHLSWVPNCEHRFVLTVIDDFGNAPETSKLMSQD